MSQKLKIIVQIENENGETVIEKTSEREIPDIREFDKQGFRTSFDQIERAFLTGRKEVSDEAVSEYIELISKKKINEESFKKPETFVKESQQTYGIEAELGSIDVVTHELRDQTGKKVYSTAGDYFEKKNPMQRFQSPCMEELELQLSSVLSYRIVTDHLNRIRNQTEGVKVTTLRNTVEHHGKTINSTQHSISAEVLKENGFSINGEILPDTNIPVHLTSTINEEEVLAAAAELELSDAINISDYEDLKQTINISVDDVLSDRQASNRPDSPEKGKKKYVSNTVVHIQQDEKAFIINDRSIKGALELLMGFLVMNSLIWSNQFVFFTDGASNINEPISTMFGFASYKIILDWYHLCEKVKQRLSMGMKGFKLRNAFLELLMPVLWKGDIAGAIKMLEDLPDNQVKDRTKVTKLIEYLERNQKYIPCYMMRAKLGLRNSSNCVENANGRIVSYRQKSQGMSWSREGSAALATVSALQINGELINWTKRRALQFGFDKDAA